jgi:hypothetical protein
MKVVHNGTTLTFTFDGEEPLVFDSTKAHANMTTAATMHGWDARLRDTAAIPRKQADGSVITVTEKMRRDSVKTLIDHYESGIDQWALRAPGAPRAPVQNAAIAALAAAMGKTYAEAEAHIATALVAEMQAKIDAGE